MHGFATITERRGLKSSKILQRNLRVFPSPSPSLALQNGYPKCLIPDNPNPRHLHTHCTCIGVTVTLCTIVFQCPTELRSPTPCKFDAISLFLSLFLWRERFLSKEIIMQESRREEIGGLDETFDEFFPSSFPVFRNGGKSNSKAFPLGRILWDTGRVRNSIDSHRFTPLYRSARESFLCSRRSLHPCRK